MYAKRSLLDLTSGHWLATTLVSTHKDSPAQDMSLAVMTRSMTLCRGPRPLENRVGKNAVNVSPGFIIIYASNHHTIVSTKWR